MLSKYKEAFLSLNPEQKNAVTQIDGPVLVIAGPGTGKTQLLTTRIAYILDVTDVLPENILCLTFTESAAITLRERLSYLIDKAAYDVTISTYHAFGSELIRTHSDYFMNFSDMEPIDDLGIDNIFREIINELPFDSPLKFSDNYIGEVKTLISDAKKALLLPNDLRLIAKHNEKFLKTANPIVADCLSGLVRMDIKAIPMFEKLLNDLESKKLNNNVKTDTVTPLSDLVISSLKEALDHTHETGKQLPLTAWKNVWLEKSNDNIFVVNSLRTQEKLRAIADIYESYKRELKVRGLYDYDDMILEAVKTLEENDDLRFSLQEKYQYILLDEFQDTNRAQFKLVELLTNNPVYEGRPDVLAVGDDDQAIYAFQGADYSNMLYFKNKYTDVRLVTLTKNYRSQKGILYTARGIAEQIEERLNHHFPEIEKLLTSENKPDSSTIVQRLNAKSDLEQFGWISKRIKELAEKGIPLKEIAVLSPQHKYLEPLTAFLYQQHLPVHYEKRDNILDDPVINEILRMCELIAAISDTKFELADSIWPEVLSYPFWNLETTKIWELSWKARADKVDWTSAILVDESLKDIGLFFIKLAMLTGNETLEMIIDYLIGVTSIELQDNSRSSPYNSPFYNYYFGDSLSSNLAVENNAESTVPNFRLGQFWQLLSNLTVLRAKLKDYKRNELPELSLSDLLSFVRAHREANIKILNTSPHQEDSDSVQLMTAFKAKGQEFQVVFILACIDEAWGMKSKGQVNRLRLPQNLQYIRYAGANSDERLRLFYVALTRAKKQLYMVGYTSNFNGKATTPLRYLNEGIDENGSVISPLLPTNSTDVVDAIDVSGQPKVEELAAYWQKRHQLALTQSTLLNLIRSRIQNYQISPTDVGKFTDVVYGGPAALLMYNLLRFPSAPTPELGFGNSMHETLQWINVFYKTNEIAPNIEKTMDVFEQRLVSKRLSKQVTKKLLDRGRHTLNSYLSQRISTLSVANESEFNFRNEGVFIGDAHMSGTIDKLIIDKAKRTISIVDYKTGNSYKKWQHTPKLHKYRQQLYLYKVLVEKSHTYAGYKVEDAYIEFVEPDDEGNIQELHLQFDNSELRDIEKLTESVWHHIKDLDLPDIDDYSKDIEGIEKFEDFLIDKE